MHSLARNHALVDGNKRLARAATIAFLGMNGIRLTGYSNDQAYDLVISARDRTARRGIGDRCGARPTHRHACVSDGGHACDSSG